MLTIGEILEHSQMDWGEGLAIKGQAYRQKGKNKVILDQNHIQLQSLKKIKIEKGNNKVDQDENYKEAPKKQFSSNAEGRGSKPRQVLYILRKSPISFWTQTYPLYLHVVPLYVGLTHVVLGGFMSA